MRLRYACHSDRAVFERIYPHMSDALFTDRVASGGAYVIEEDGKAVGVMHHCLFWDSLPCLSLIYLLEPYRGKGIGSAAMNAWEEEMRGMGGTMVLTSTQADEGAQHFYRKRGYIDCGALFLHGTPHDQPAELFLRKLL